MTDDPKPTDQLPEAHLSPKNRYRIRQLDL